MARGQQRLYTAIGRVAAECSRLDASLRNVFCCLIDDRIGLVITAGEDTSRLIQLCRRVAPYSRALANEDVPEFEALLANADHLRDRRNYVVHAEWAPFGSPGLHVATRSKRAPDSPRTTDRTRPPRLIHAEIGYHDVPQVNELADALAQTREAIDDFCQRAFAGDFGSIIFPRGFKMYPDANDSPREPSSNGSREPASTSDHL